METQLKSAPLSKQFQYKCSSFRSFNRQKKNVQRVRAEQDIPSLQPEMTTEKWRQTHEKDGTVDLWLLDEFSAASRISGGRAALRGDVPGTGSGEGPSTAETRKVKIIDKRNNDKVYDVEVPVDRYILYEAQAQGLELPYQCKMGCCTQCAVKVKEGELKQTQALGVSQQLRDNGYALMCVAYPTTDLVLETVAEDEVYDMQFGESFAARAIDPYNKDTVERDDFALEIANMDE